MTRIRHGEGHRGASFRVAKNPLEGDYWITEDGRPMGPRWWSRGAAQMLLNQARDRAEKVVRLGYFQGDASGSIYVFIDAQRVDITLPCGFTEGDRSAAIRTAAMQHILDRVNGDEEG